MSFHGWPLKKENLSCLQAKDTEQPIQDIPSIPVPLHWSHDTSPCSGTALYMEWIRAQPTTQRLPRDSQVISQGCNIQCLTLLLPSK